MNVLVKAGGLFLICSFLGWCLEAAAVSVRKKSFVNKGVLNGPLCPVYGITFLIVLAVTKDLQDNWFFLLDVYKRQLLILTISPGSYDKGKGTAIFLEPRRHTFILCY